MVIQRAKYSLLIAACGIFSAQAHPVARPAYDVFAKWYDWQAIMPDKDLTTMAQSLHGETLKKHYLAGIHNLAEMTPFLDLLTASYINKDGFILRSAVPKEIEQNFALIHKLIQDDMPALVKFLKASPMLTKELISGEQFSNNANQIIDKYSALFQLLFAHQDAAEAQKYLFTAANHFYEYCFQEATFPTFERMLLDPHDQPIARMLYTVIWYNLAGNGWKHWHEDCLKNLKTAADSGKTIKYIAGGSDILQMLNAGIFNIKNIDPELPSQPKYYANGWEFIIRSEAEDGGIGDQITIPLKNQNVIMVRTGFVLTGETFKARLNTNEIIEIPRSVTTWQIQDEHGTKLGEYVLDRRFCTQEDFVASENETLLMSFNELYFIGLPSFLNGWQIEPTQLPSDLNIIVKQLRKPVSREMIFNMRIAALLNATDFKFIALGTCIN